jgi:hypothetical protein
MDAEEKITIYAKTFPEALARLTEAIDGAEGVSRRWGTPVGRLTSRRT